MAHEHINVTPGAFESLKTLQVAGTNALAKVAAERVVADFVIIQPTDANGTLAFSASGAEFPVPATGLTLESREGKNFDLTTFYVKGSATTFNFLYRSTGKTPS